MHGLGHIAVITAAQASNRSSGLTCRSRAAAYSCFRVVTPRWLVFASALRFSTAAPGCDARRGEQIYNPAMPLHTTALGPRHCGLFGRRAGSAPGFDYSPAMKNSNITWNDKMLEHFLAKPLAVVPGTTMTYDGLPDPKDRSDLIAYLMRASTSPECTK